jgi:predicted RecA/RadA family phage recombinase
MTDLWSDAEIGEIIGDGTVYSFEAEGNISKGKCVYLSSDMKVSQCSAEGDAIGIALRDVNAGEFCPVCVRGVVKVTAYGAITRGTAVQTHTNGDVKALADQAVDEGGTGTYTIYYARKLGFALQTFADGDTGLIIMEK